MKTGQHWHFCQRIWSWATDRVDRPSMGLVCNTEEKVKTVSFRSRSSKDGIGKISTPSRCFPATISRKRCIFCGQTAREVCFTFLKTKGSSQQGKFWMTPLLEAKENSWWIQVSRQKLSVGWGWLAHSAVRYFYWEQNIGQEQEIPIVCRTKCTAQNRTFHLNSGQGVGHQSNQHVEQNDDGYEVVSSVCADSHNICESVFLGVVAGFAYFW